MALLLDLAVSILLEKALKELVGVFQIIACSKTRGKELKAKLLSLKPTIDEICKNFSDSDSRGTQFKEFQVVLLGGLNLAERLEKTHWHDITEKLQYGKELNEFQKKVYDFLVQHGSPDLTLALQELTADARDSNQRLRRIEGLIEDAIRKMTNVPTSSAVNTIQVFQTIQVLQVPSDGMYDAHQSIDCTLQVPCIPKNLVLVGLDNPINSVKELLFKNDVNCVGVTGMGGRGKTTLAVVLCNNPEVQNFFESNMIFITVSQSPNVKGLLEMMWDKIIRVPRPPFQSIEDAHNQLQKNLSSKAHRRTLVVLDDVWSISNLDDLLFEAEGYKTIITTRQGSIIPTTDSTRLYDMPILEDADSRSLFCFWAFGQTSIPPTQEDKDIVKQVVAECGRLPLALRVIGRSLRGALPPVWKSAMAKLSRAEPLTDYHRERLINRLETSIDVLDNKQKQCFLDLGAFPEGRKFRVDSLLDIWVYVRQMEREDAFAVLVELEDRNLLDFTRNPGSQSISYNCSSELCFSQHDVMRDLALHLASKDSVIDRERLFIAHKNDSNPAQGLNTLKDKSSRAQFLSIHTGAMQEQDWGQIDFPEVEALALFFAANQYCLPTFLHSMPKLKVLIICNYNSKRAVLQALPDFSSLTQIKSLLLERLSVPSLYEHCRTWKSLEKASVCLCEGLGNMTPSDNEQVLELPKFVEINLDHCIDLEKLPGEICNLTSLQGLSVTNCHHIQKLPDDIGNLRSLTVLRLSTCIGLTMLPPSICKLQQLEFLDISQCGALKNLPNEFHQLSNLKTLDMRECSRLKKLPTVLGSLRSLERVICDENTEQQWLGFKASVMPNLRVDIVKEDFNLDWLLD